MNNKVNLKEWGLRDSIMKKMTEEEIRLLGRVISEGNKIYKVITINGVLIGEAKGSLVHEAEGTEDFPAVGDWVVLDRNEPDTGNAIITKILDRRSKVSRKTAGNRLDEQIIASNIDYIFICMSLNKDFNLRRVERYLTIVWDSGAQPVILLTKADLSEDVDEKVKKVEEIALGTDIVVSSSLSGEGMERVLSYLWEGTTCAFIGSSGVGKSSIINYIKGEDVMDVKGLRNDDKGRHTTTHREVLTVPGRGVVIDTPGMREIQILDVDDSLERTFSDIDEIMKNCRFSDCSHETEPGCAVREALETGELSPERWQSYLKMKNEIEYFKRKADKSAEGAYRAKFKKINKQRRQKDKYLRKHKDS